MVADKNGVRVLYTSDQLRAAIKRLMSAPVTGDCRVAMVAYVGGEADTYLPNPEGLKIVCALQPGSTSAVTLGRLKRNGAVLYQSDRLHMKVYWSSRLGCVIGSANASGNALGGRGSKEAGVWLPPGMVDIGTLWDYADPRTVLKADLERLAASEPGREPGQKRVSDAKPSDFLEWLDNEGRTPWKLGWWSHNTTCEIAENAKEEAQTRFGVTTPKDFMTASNGQVEERDWLLSFDIDAPNAPKWFYADIVVEVSRGDKGAYVRDWPFQAVMLHQANSYSPLPFKLDNRFRQAFAAGVGKFGANLIYESKSLVPPAGLLRLVKELWPSAPR
jgi:hypothetical protein